jgi:hypothetical protein
MPFRACQDFFERFLPWTAKEARNMSGRVLLPDTKRTLLPYNEEGFIVVDRIKSEEKL